MHIFNIHIFTQRTQLTTNSLIFHNFIEYSITDLDRKPKSKIDLQNILLNEKKVRDEFNGLLGMSERKLDMLIFFWDPMEAQPHDPDIKALLRVAVTWNILIACNRATADFLLTSQLMNQDYESIIQDYSSYTNRKLK